MFLNLNLRTQIFRKLFHVRAHVDETFFSTDAATNHRQLSTGTSTRKLFRVHVQAA